MDFAVSCLLVRYGRLLFGFCPSTRTFVPCFLRTSPRGDSPCIITRPSPPSGRPEDFHLLVTEHAQHTTKPLARRTLRVLLARSWSSNKSCRSTRSAVSLAAMANVDFPTQKLSLSVRLSRKTPFKSHSYPRPPRTPAPSYWPSVMKIISAYAAFCCSVSVTE